jgi:hypothetical protein
MKGPMGDVSRRPVMLLGVTGNTVGSDPTVLGSNPREAASSLCSPMVEATGLEPVQRRFDPSHKYVWVGSKFPETKTAQRFLGLRDTISGYEPEDEGSSPSGATLGGDCMKSPCPVCGKEFCSMGH